MWMRLDSRALAMELHLFCNYHPLFRVWSWWRHQMETFSALLAICAGNSPVPGEFPTQRPATRSFDVFFDLHLIKRLSKHSWGWWFETLSPPLWRHRNVMIQWYALCVSLYSYIQSHARIWVIGVTHAIHPSGKQDNVSLFTWKRHRMKRN